MSDRAAIVLASGLSRRMGVANKLLEGVGTQAIVCRVVVACAAATDHPVRVVTGYQAQARQMALANLPTRFAHNSRFEDGQMSYVDTGMRHVPEAQTYLLALEDQPKITAVCLLDLLQPHQTAAGDRITMPIVRGERGPPIVVSASKRARMVSGSVYLGCRNQTRSGRAVVHSYATADGSCVLNVATPDELARKRQALLLDQETRQ